MQVDHTGKGVESGQAQAHDSIKSNRVFRWFKKYFAKIRGIKTNDNQSSY